MKTKYAILAIVLTIAMTLSLFGQDTRDEKTKADMRQQDMKQHDMSNMMGKPTLDATVEGLHMKVWLMTQAEHSEMMKGKMGLMGKRDTSMEMGKDMKRMKHDDMGMDKATKEAMMVGTHHIMLDLTDADGEKEITNTSARVMIVSPSKKNSSVDLKPMMRHLGNGLTLNEKGKYQLTVSVNVNGSSKTKQFQYTVK